MDEYPVVGKNMINQVASDITLFNELYSYPWLLIRKYNKKL